MSLINLMLVDDHDIVRTGLKTFLQTQEGFTIIGEANNGESAVQLALELKPDVIIMDISMPRGDGLEATRQITARWPQCKVLALTVHADKQYFFEMLSAGAVGYVTKQAAAEELVAAIRAVAQGSVYLQPALAVWLLEDYRRLQGSIAERSTAPGAEDPSRSLDVLSEREQQVLEGVAEGMTNPEIGAKLGISPKTVARHRERIMHKLNLHSCPELVKFAIRTGLIEIR